MTVSFFMEYNNHLDLMSIVIYKVQFIYLSRDGFFIATSLSGGAKVAFILWLLQ